MLSIITTPPYPVHPLSPSPALSLSLPTLNSPLLLPHSFSPSLPLSLFLSLSLNPSLSLSLSLPRSLPLTLSPTYFPSLLLSFSLSLVLSLLSHLIRVLALAYKKVSASDFNLNRSDIAKKGTHHIYAAAMLCAALMPDPFYHSSHFKMENNASFNFRFIDVDHRCLFFHHPTHYAALSLSCHSITMDTLRTNQIFLRCAISLGLGWKATSRWAKEISPAVCLCMNVCQYV